MNKYNLRLDFLWDDEIDSKYFTVYTPDNVGEIELSEIIKREHHFLDFEDKEEIYGFQGRSPETLMDYICEKYDWKWKDFEFDMVMLLN